MNKLSFLITLFILPFLSKAALKYEGFEGDYWSSHVGVFQVKGQSEKAKIPLECIDKTPLSFRVERISSESPPFPCLTTTTPDFYEQVASWIRTVHLVPGKFNFKGTYIDPQSKSEKTFIVNPSYLDEEGKPKKLAIELLSMRAVPNFEKGRLIFEYVLVAVPTEAHLGTINVLSAIPDLSEGYPLEVISITPFSRLKDIIVTKGYGVYETAVFTTRYMRPRLTQITEWEGLSDYEEVRSYNEKASVYKEAVGSDVFSSGPQAEEFLEFEEEEGAPPSEISADPSSIHPFQPKKALFEKYYQLLPTNPRQVESPYLWSNGIQLFLTKTFEHDCRAILSSPEDLSSSFFLKYTMPTDLAVGLQSYDTRLQAKFFPTGLYELKDGSLMRLQKEGYHSIGSDYGVAPHKEGTPLFTRVKILQESSHTDLVSVYPFIGALKNYIHPDDKTVADNRGYEELIEQFKKEGIIPAVLSLPPHKQHLIVPFLKWVRNQKDGWEMRAENQKLFQYNGGGRPEVSLWQPYVQGVSLQDIISFPTIDGERMYGAFFGLHIYHWEGLKFLPLLKSDGVEGLSSIYFWWPTSKPTADYPRAYEPGPGGNGVMSPEQWEDVARVLKMNQFRKFNFSSQYRGPSSFPFFEPDFLLTIHPFARALKDQTVLEEYVFSSEMVGLKNLECLLGEGISHNKSIKKFTIHSTGHVPVGYIGKMLEVNDTISHLSLGCDAICDLECLNILGRSLKKNKTLRNFCMSISNEMGLSGVCYTTQDFKGNFTTMMNGRFLPKRSSDPVCTCRSILHNGLQTIEHSSCSNISGFVEGLLESNIVELSLSFIFKSPPHYVQPNVPSLLQTVSEMIERLSQHKEKFTGWIRISKNGEVLLSYK